MSMLKYSFGCLILWLIPLISLSQQFVELRGESGLKGFKQSNGIAVADFDNDNDLDVYVSANQSWTDPAGTNTGALFRNNNDGSFTDVTSDMGIATNYDFSGVDNTRALLLNNQGPEMSVSWADYDNDGFVDLLLTAIDNVRLFRNLNGTAFQEVTNSVGLPTMSSCNYSGGTWWDYNNDGNLDLYLLKWGGCSTNSLYRNNGDGTFIDATSEAQIHDPNVSSPDFSYTAIPIDLNSDGLLDLYVANDFDIPNRAYINSVSGVFSERATELSINDSGDDMGLAIGDYNNDGNFDFFITDIFQGSFYSLNAAGDWENLYLDLKTIVSGWAWGVQFVDIDNDLDEDLIIVSGFDEPNQNQLFENLLDQEIEEFRFIGATSGLNSEDYVSYCIGAFDYDNDGDVDIAITNKDEPISFYENNEQNLSGDHWVQLKFEGIDSNKDGFGTKISVRTNDVTQHKLYNGISFLGQNVQGVHFGLGDHDIVDEIIIEWPSGTTDTYTNLPVNRFIKATEGNGYTLIDIQPSIKIPGCTDPKSCNYDPTATTDDNTCVYLPSLAIAGSSSSAPLKVETYTYPIADGSEYYWSVTGGEIVSGHGTNKIEVHWGIFKEGHISLIEKNSCYGQEVTKTVELKINNLKENHSVARLWNEALLQSIRWDFARPTVHARNLFHSSILMYDTWAIYKKNTKPYLIGESHNDFVSQFDGFEYDGDIEEGISTTISFAMRKLLLHRFANSPNATETFSLINDLMLSLGYSSSNTSLDYSSGDPIALGNFIAETIINYGLGDGSNEALGYSNIIYEATNAPLLPVLSGNPDMIDPNKWQPLQLDVFIDQSGNPIAGNTPEFLSPEWGNVYPFALSTTERRDYNREEGDYKVFYDPGAPPMLNLNNQTQESELYQWNHTMVSVWQSHLDPTDGVMWDISPGNIGNIALESLPKSLEDHVNFYNYFDGGDISPGHTINPITNRAYEPQWVPRGDYVRILAEFWADGPDSETPPGHWFVLLNYVNDHPQMIKRLNGEGEILSDLEWDVKSYFILGGAMHDAAIAAWSVKGWYDYVRPISAIRYMADLGQSTDASLDNYHVAGIPLLEGYVEVIDPGDPLAGIDDANVGKIKLYTWRGHDYISNTETDQAGVGWILAENWWPYQRPSFVTPPFAGYVSGHSTYSRAAAETMTLLTGSPYFPGGMGEFVARKNEFLVFEEGPSQDVTLQWATYRDASDQCSLSRIWGGIHPPADDIPGRLMGEKIGKAAYHYAVSYFNSNVLSVSSEDENKLYVFPNPIASDNHIYIQTEDLTEIKEIQLYTLSGSKIKIQASQVFGENIIRQELPELPVGIYLLRVGEKTVKILMK